MNGQEFAHYTTQQLFRLRELIREQKATESEEEMFVTALRFVETCIANQWDRLGARDE